MWSVAVTFGAIVVTLLACAVCVTMVWYAANGPTPWLRMVAGLFALVVLAGLITSMAYAISAPWEHPCMI